MWFWATQPIDSIPLSSPPLGRGTWSHTSQALSFWPFPVKNDSIPQSIDPGIHGRSTLHGHINLEASQKTACRLTESPGGHRTHLPAFWNFAPTTYLPSILTHCLGLSSTGLLNNFRYFLCKSTSIEDILICSENSLLPTNRELLEPSPNLHHPDPKRAHENAPLLVAEFRQHAFGPTDESTPSERLPFSNDFLSRTTFLPSLPHRKSSGMSISKLTSRGGRFPRSP